MIRDHRLRIARPPSTRARAQRRRTACVALTAGAWIVVALSTVAYGGSSAPKAAIADAVATVEGEVVTLEIFGNFDYGNFIRLGYPAAVMVTTANGVARLGFDGSVDLAPLDNPWDGSSSNGAASAPAPAGGPGVIAIGPERLLAVLPPEIVAAQRALVRIEARFDFAGTTYDVRSNSVAVSW